MPTTYISLLLHQITDFRYRVIIVIDGDIIYLILVRGVEICVHYGFVWIFEPMVGTLFVQLCLKTVLSAHYQVAFLYIYSGQKYKNEDDTIIMIM